MKKEYQIIAKFNYNERQYFIILINNKKIEFAYLENGDLKKELSKSEYIMIKQIYNSLKVDKSTSFEIATKYVNGKKYKIYYDKISKNYFWELEDGEIAEEDNVILNFRYNHIPYIINFMEQNDNEPKANKLNNAKFFTKLKKIVKNRIIPIFIASTISLNAISTYEVQSISEWDNDPTAVQSVEDREYNWKEIRQAIKQNPFLTDSEKNFLYECKFIFDENNQYMDLDLILHRLATLKIYYINKQTDENNAQIITGGTYNIISNRIKLYETDKFEDCIKQKKINRLIHEIGHVFQSEPEDRYIEELSAETFAREVLRRMYDKGILGEDALLEDNENVYFGNGYDWDIYFYYMLADLLPTETLKKYNFKLNSDTIVEGLCEIDNYGKTKISAEEQEETEKRAYTFLNNLDDLRKNGEKKEEYTKSVVICERQLSYYKSKYDEYMKKSKNTPETEETQEVDRTEIYKDLENAVYDVKYWERGDMQIYEATLKTLKELLDIEGARINLKDIYFIGGPILDIGEIIRKTYYTDDHPETEVVLELAGGKGIKIKITDELKEKYKNNLAKVEKENLRRESKSPVIERGER